MPEQIQAQHNQISQIGVEGTPGIPVVATKRLLSLSLPFTPGRDIGEIRPQGFKIPVAHPQNRVWSEGSVGDGSGLAYNEAPYWLSSLFRKTTPVEIVRPPWAASTPYDGDDYILENGSIWRATTAGTSGTVEPDWTTAPLVGNTVADNTVVWTNMGAHVPAYEWIFDMATRGRDDVQTYTIETGDAVSGRAFQVANAFFSGFSIESARGGDLSVDGDLMGSARVKMANGLTVAGVTEDRIRPATPAHLNVYMDDNPSDLGLTQLDGNFSSNVGVGDRANHVWFHGRQYRGPAGRVEGIPDITAEFVQADGNEVDDMIVGLETGEQKFFRFNFQGPEIAPGIHHTLDWDFCGNIADNEDFDEEDNVYAATVPFGVEHSPDWGRGTQVRVVTTLSNL